MCGFATLLSIRVSAVNTSMTAPVLFLVVVVDCEHFARRSWCLRIFALDVAAVIAFVLVCINGTDTGLLLEYAITEGGLTDLTFPHLERDIQNKQPAITKKSHSHCSSLSQGLHRPTPRS